MNSIKISDKNEGTSAPYWIIIDPKQNFSVGEQGIYNIAFMFSGVFFSRESAQAWLDCQKHNYSKHARVYCHSGHYSTEWREAIENGNIKKESGNE